MRRMLLCLFLALTACAPVSITVPPNVPKVTAEPKAQIPATVAVTFDHLSDEFVVRKYRVWNQYQSNERRREVAKYHIAAASRELLSTAFERLFTRVEYITGPIEPGDGVGDVDLVLVPHVKYFTTKDSRAQRGAIEALVAYEVIFLDKTGAQYGRDDFVGGATTSEAAGTSSNDVNALKLAMEQAANSLVTDLPKSVPMRRWRGY